MSLVSKRQSVVMAVTAMMILSMSFAYPVVGADLGAESEGIDANLSSSVSEYSVGDAVHTTTRLNTRYAPSVNYPVIKTLEKRTSGKIIDGPSYHDGYTWWLVEWEDGTHGWSVEKYLGPGWCAKFCLQDHVHTTVDLNVRNGAGLDNGVVGTMSQGTMGTVVGGPQRSDGYTWWKVKYEDGTVGYSVEKYLKRGKPDKAEEGFVWPVSGPITANWYDQRSYGNHKAIDIGAPRGTPVGAARGGEVIETGYYSAAGYTVFIEHENGYVTKYMHLSEFAVSEGETVSQGETIAYVGSSGHSTGPHLHFEIERYSENVYIPGAEGASVEKGDKIDEDYDV